MTRVLVLLVGTNPLPNWVSWLYLSRTARESGAAFDRLVLICSSRDSHQGGTADIADRLKRQIGAHCTTAGHSPPKIRIEPIKDPADGQEISAAVRAAVDGCDEVHLNYTGGTKVMAVHAFAFIQSGEFKSISSYLDARQFCLRFSEGPPSPDLRPRVAVELDDLFELHDITWDKERPLGFKKPLFPRTAELILQSFLNDPNGTRSWCRECDGARQGNVEWLPGCEGLPSVFRDESNGRYNLGDPGDRIDFSLLRNKRERERIRTFFGGVWLESVVLKALLKVQPDYTPRMNIESRRRGARPKMEIDVMAQRGYQLFVFSCGTSDRHKWLKSKGFEAAHRAAQLGGEEARSVLVTTVPSFVREGLACVADLQADLDSDLGGAMSVQVLGFDDLIDLSTALRRKVFEET
jgi:hypothetical protein